MNNENLPSNRSSPGLSEEVVRTRQIRTNLKSVLTEIVMACKRSDRALSDIKIIPITKYVDPDLVEALFNAGLREFGESTIQETMRKRQSLGDLVNLQWHLVGHLQRNKAARALELYHVIHSLDSFRLAETLDKKLHGDPSAKAQPTFFVEVNVAEDPAKSGLPCHEVLPFLEKIHSQTSLGYSLRGLMTIAPIVSNPEDTRPYFRKLRELRDQAITSDLLQQGAELSMGMSNDFPIAVEEGASLLRIGSRLFEGLPTRINRK